MKLARIAHSNGVSFASLEGVGSDGSLTDAVAREIAEHPFGEPTLTNNEWPLADVRLLAPILATKLISITGAHNNIPRFVIKPNTSIVGPNSVITCPDDVQELYAGPTVGAVIGKPCRKLHPDEVSSALLGFTVAADITALDVASVDGDFSRAKSYDGFCPLGPWIDTDYDIEHVQLENIHDNVISQRLSYADFPLPVDELIAELSYIMTLLPGDTILLGTRYNGVPITAGGTDQIIASGFAPLVFRVRCEKE